MLSCVKTVGELSSTVEYALAILGHYIVCKKFESTAPPKNQNMVSKKVNLGGSKCTSQTLL